MKKIIFVTGGQRSGKSSFAQANALKLSENPVYLATARIWDEDFHERIKRHQADRGKEWENIEEQLHLSYVKLQGRVVVLDCITLWLNNIWYLKEYDLKASLAFAKKEWDLFKEQDFTLYVVTNELGMSVHSENEASRKFADLQGWVNQMIAKDSDEVYLMVSGIPVKVK
jgi:adenosylcobinamide kinase/adenosylcobinamide-phosphate guanylyltransferase